MSTELEEEDNETSSQGKDHEMVVVPADVTPPPVPATDQIPDGGYGWICVLCVATVNNFVWRVAASYGVYLAHYLADDTFSGATPLAMALAPFATIITRKLGTRSTMMIGVVIHALGFIIASFSAGRIWVLYLTQGMLIGMGISFLFILSVAVLQQRSGGSELLHKGLPALAPALED